MVKRIDAISSAQPGAAREPGMGAAVGGAERGSGNAEWLKQLGDLVSAFPAGQTPSSELFAQIRNVVDETIISILESGGELPAFILQPERIAAMRDRLGDQRVAELIARPLSPPQITLLVPLATRLCRAFDALSKAIGG